MTLTHRMLTSNEQAEVLELADRGWSIMRLSAHFNTTRHRIDAVVTPQKSVARKLRKRLLDQSIRADQSASRKAAGMYKVKANPRMDRDGMRLLKLVPKDTRSLTGRLMGDPLIGRSALDHRRAQENSSGYQQAATNSGDSEEKSMSPARCVWQFQR